MERPGHHQHQPGVNLPAQNITVVRRSDGSGTTFIWTNYLSRVSEEWKTKVGENPPSTGRPGWVARATKA